MGSGITKAFEEAGQVGLSLGDAETIASARAMLSAGANKDANTTEVVDDYLQEEMSEHSNRNTKLGRGIVTCFCHVPNMDMLDPDWYFGLGKAEEMFQVWCGQYEICPETKALHFHIYFEFKNNKKMRFNTFMKAFRKQHFRVNIKSSKQASKKQRQCAINYVTDDNKRAPDTEFYAWPGSIVEIKFDPSFVKTAKGGDKKEAEKQKCIDWIESKPRHYTWGQILHESDESKSLLATCSWGRGYHACRASGDEERVIKEVIIMYGAGGTGKTTMARSYEGASKDEVYVRNFGDGTFWGSSAFGYNGQKIVLYEEFVGQEQFSALKQVCDIGISGPPINIKNSGGKLNHEVVIFTSNTHPAGFYKGLWERDPNNFDPFRRRVTKVLFFPETRPDGSDNRPDAEHPPHFIDQTAEWEAMGRSYEACQEHAAEHWPLKSEEDDRATVFVQGRKRGQVGGEEPPFYKYCRTGKY